MEWKYPVEFVTTDKTAYRVTGIFGAAAPL
jgi:hypothetical protein